MTNNRETDMKRSDSGASHTRGDRGDTLIEVLIAMVILGFVSASAFLAFGGLTYASGTYRSIAVEDSTIASVSSQVASELQYQANPLYLTCATATDYNTGGSNALTLTGIPKGYSASVTSVSLWNAPSFSTKCASTSTYTATQTGTSPNYVYTCPKGGVDSGTTCTITTYPQSEKVTLKVANTKTGVSQSNDVVVNNPYTTNAPPNLTPTQLVFLSQPPAIVYPSQAISPDIKVALENIKGQVSTGDSSIAILTVTTGAGYGTATLNHGCTGSENLGVFTFSNCDINNNPGVGDGRYTLTVSDGSLIATSTQFGVEQQLSAPVITSATATSGTPGAITIDFTGSTNASSNQTYTAEVCTNTAMTSGCFSATNFTSGDYFTGLVGSTTYYITVSDSPLLWYLPATSTVSNPTVSSP